MKEYKNIIKTNKCTFICFNKLKYQFLRQFQVLRYDKRIIAPDFNEVSKQGLGQKLNLSIVCLLIV